MDTPEFLKDCFEFDWKTSKISKLVKTYDETE